MGRTCGEPDEIKKNTHPKNITALFRDRVQSVCGFKAINVQDDWGDGGAPQAYTKFFEDLFPDVPWFEV